MRLLLIISLFFTTHWAAAQLSPVRRLEQPANEQFDEGFRILPLGEQGALMIYHRRDDYSRQPHTYRFIRMDTTLTQRWENDYTIPERFSPTQTFDNDRFLFMLAEEVDTESFTIMRLNLDDGALETFTGKLPSSLLTTDFKVMGNMAYLAGYYRSRPVVMAYSLFDGSIRVFQGLYVNNVELGSMEVDEFRQEVHLVTHTLKKNCQFTLRSYSPDGKPLRVHEYSGTQYSLISGKILPISADESLLVGNYSTDCTPYSQGLYFTRIRHNETGKLTVTTNQGEAIRYVDFGKLKNFFNYLNPRRQVRMKARLAEQQRQGKEPKFRYRLQVHDLMPTPNGLRLVAEVYYPQFRGSVTPYASNSWRSMSGTTQGRYRSAASPLNTGVNAQDRYTDGYRYTHAFVCEFDQNGTLLWDNCFPISDLTDNKLTQKVQIMPQGNRLVMAYEQDSEIKTTLIERDSVLSVSDAFKILTGSDKEKVQSSADEELTAWYGPYFLATGYQKIVPERGFISQTRDVFYVNKLHYNAFMPPPAASPTAKPAAAKLPGSGR